MESSKDIKDGLKLGGKVAVVTGAARGIGRAVAVAFAKEGASVIGIDICEQVDPRSGVEPSTFEDLEETGQMVRAEGQGWLGIKLDQRDLPALRFAAAQVEREFGGIDILFANAEIQSFHPLLEMEDADWNITIDVNLTGTANAIRAFKLHQKTRRRAHHCNFVILRSAWHETWSRLFRIEVGNHRLDEVGSTRTRPI